MTTTEPRAQTLRAQRLVNSLVRGLLRTPLVCRLIGRRLIVVHVVGRLSGRRYAVPVAYTRTEDATLLIGTPFAWGRNLRDGSRVTVRLRGRIVDADVRVVTDEAGVVDAYALMCRDNRNFAAFTKIRLAADGTPDAGDLHAAWAAGAHAFYLRPASAP